MNLKTMTIGFKLFSGYAIVLLLLIISSSGSYWSLSSTESNLNNVIQNKDLICGLADREKEHLAWMNQLTEAIISKQKFTGQLDPNQCNFGKWYNNSKTKEDINNRSDKAKNLYDQMNQPHTNLHQSAQKINSKIEVLKTVSDQEQMQKILDEANSIYSDQTKNHVTQLQELFHQFREEIETNNKTVQKNVEDNASYVKLGIIIFGVIAVLISALIASLITRSLTRQIGGEPQHIMDIANQVANRDLTVKLNENKQTTGIYSGIIKMVSNLKSVLVNISEVSSNLAASSEELNAAANNLSENTQNQAASVEETSASTEQLASSIRQVFDHAITMQDKSEKSLTEAQGYKDNMTLVTHEMENISESTEKIGNIIKVINDIADQTNLLSLNAAIEAARAGEHGRGFAVVADAISSLATRSAESTKEIEKLIRDSVERINNGVDSVKKSNNSFDAIINTIQENNEVISNITKAMEEQRIGSEQIQRATEEVNAMTQGNSSSAEEMASTTSQLQNLAEQLNNIASSFKLIHGRRNGGINSSPSSVDVYYNYSYDLNDEDEDY